MTKNSGFGDINNCNSLDSSVVSSPTVNSIRRNSFYKLTNVLLLLFLLFGSSVVSFGMNQQIEMNNMNKNKMDSKPLDNPPQNQTLINNINEPKEDDPVDIAPRDQYLGVPSIINKISMLFLTKVMSADEKNMKDKVVEKNKKFFVALLSLLLGLNDHHSGCNNYGTGRGHLLSFYFICTILANSFYRGIFSVKPCFKKIKEGGNWELYFGVGNVPYVGWLFNFSLVCKPTKYLPDFLQNKVTIHIFDFKPFNFILGCVFSTWLIWYTNCKKLYILPQWILGFGTVEINIAKYYNISLNVGSWIVDWITFMKYTKEANENVIKKDNQNKFQDINA